MDAAPPPDESLLRRYLRGELLPGEADAVERYLDAHPELADTLNKLSGPDTLADALKDDPPTVDTALVLDVCSRAAPADETAAFDAPPADGEVIGTVGGYVLVKLLGRGGMGAVYEAHDPRLGRRVALKMMRTDLAERPSARERFLREGKAAAAVEHEHIIPVYQVGEDAGTPFLAMPLLPGECLEDRLKRGPVPLAEQLLIGRQVAEGLAAAHAAGLVHRDVKPSNIWLEAHPNGTFRRVRLLDFGLARSASGDGQLTASGTVMGTPAYMAPEQARDAAKVDHRADLFSLGGVLYRMATGKPAFAGEDAFTLLTSIATTTPLPAAKVNPAVPRRLSDLIGRLLEKEAKDRLATADEVARGLGEIASGVSPPRRRRWAAVAAGFFFVGLLVAAGVIIIRIKDKDGKETTVELPPGSKATIKTAGGGEVVVENPADLAADPDLTADRAAAVWVAKSHTMSNMVVALPGEAERYAVAGPDPQLPAGPFELREVKLVDLPVGDADAPRFAGLRHLRHFQMVRSGPSDNALAAILRAPALTGLTLTAAGVTDRTLGVIADRGDRLRVLGLDGNTTATDAGLRKLARLRGLRELSLIGCGGTRDAVKELAAALPGCRITSDYGAFGPATVSPPAKDLFPGELVAYETFDAPTADWPPLPLRGHHNAVEHGMFRVVVPPAAHTDYSHRFGRPAADVAFATRACAPGAILYLGFGFRRTPAAVAWLQLDIAPNGTWKLSRKTSDPTPAYPNRREAVVAESAKPDPDLAAGKWVAVAGRVDAAGYELWLNGRSAARGVLDGFAGETIETRMAAEVGMSTVAAGAARLDIDYVAVWKLPPGVALPPAKDLFPGELVAYETFDDPRPAADTPVKRVAVADGVLTTEFKAGHAGVFDNHTFGPPDAGDLAAVVRLRAANAELAVRFGTRLGGTRRTTLRFVVPPDGTWRLVRTNEELVGGAWVPRPWDVLASAAGPVPALAAGRWFTVRVRQTGTTAEVWADGGVTARADDATGLPRDPQRLYVLGAAASAAPGRIDIDHVAVWKIPPGNGVPAKDAYPGELLAYETFDDPRPAGPLALGEKPATTTTPGKEKEPRPLTVGDSADAVVRTAGGVLVTEFKPGRAGVYATYPLGKPTNGDVAVVARMRATNIRSAVTFGNRWSPTRGTYLRFDVTPEGHWSLNRVVTDVVGGIPQNRPWERLVFSPAPVPELAAGKWFTVRARAVGREVEVWADGGVYARVTDDGDLPRSSPAVGLLASVAADGATFELAHAAVWKLPPGVALPPARDAFTGELLAYETYDDPKDALPIPRGGKGVFTGVEGGAKVLAFVGMPGNQSHHARFGPPAAGDLAVATRVRTANARMSVVFGERQKGDRRLGWEFGTTTAGDGSWLLRRYENRKTGDDWQPHEYAELAVPTGPAPELVAGRWAAVVVRTRGAEIEVSVDGRKLVAVTDPTWADAGFTPVDQAVSVGGMMAEGGKDARVEIDYLAAWKLSPAAAFAGKWSGVWVNDVSAGGENKLELTGAADGTLRGTWDGGEIVARRAGAGRLEWECTQAGGGRHYRCRLREVHPGQVLAVDYTARYGAKDGKLAYVGTELFARDGGAALPPGFALTGAWAGLLHDDRDAGRATSVRLTERPDGTVRGTWDGHAVAGARTAAGKAGWEVELKGVKYRVTAEASHGGAVVNLRYVAAGGDGKSTRGWGLLAAPAPDAAPPARDAFPGDLLAYETFDDPKDARPVPPEGLAEPGTPAGVEDGAKVVHFVKLGEGNYAAVPFGGPAADVAFAARLRGTNAAVFAEFRNRKSAKKTSRLEFETTPAGGWVLRWAAWEPAAAEGWRLAETRVLAKSAADDPELAAGKWFTLSARSHGQEVEVSANGRRLARLADAAIPDADVPAGEAAASFGGRVAPGGPAKFEIDYAAVWKLPAAGPAKK